MNDEMELEIDLRDLMYRVLKKWRGVILGAVILAVLAGAIRFAIGILGTLDPEALDEAEKKYQIVLDDYNATGESLTRRIENLQEDAATQREYNEKSALMEIDPMEKYVGSFVLYIDSQYQINPSLTYQNIDLTNRLVAAYAAYLTSGEFYNEVLQKTNTVSEIRFLTEIYTIAVDAGSSTITVNCVGKSEADVQEILGLAEEEIQEKYPTIGATIGEHSYDILMESLYTTIDLSLDERQKANIQMVDDYAMSIGEATEALEEWERTPEPEREYGLEYTVKETVKFIILGGVAGALAMAVLYAAGYVLSGKVKVDGDWKVFEIAVLGHIRGEEERKRFWKIDRWLDRRIGQRRKETTLDESCELAACNLSAVLKERGLSEGVLVSDMDGQLAADITGRMNAADSGVRFVYAGNILTDGEAVRRIGEAAEVILLAQVHGTTYDNIKEERTLLGAWGKSILGAVTME